MSLDATRFALWFLLVSVAYIVLMRCAHWREAVRREDMRRHVNREGAE